MIQTDIIGRGAAFPFRIDPNGGIAMVGGRDQVEQSMRMILGTPLGERVMRPEFGCAIWDQIFDPLNPSTVGLIIMRAKEALVRWEPRIVVEDIVASGELAGDGVLVLEVRYLIRATNERRNLVYPFYVIAPEAQS